MWNDIKTWFASKGGVSHVIAGAYLFLLGAYGTVPQFHQLAQHINAALPGWAEEVAAAVVGLAAFYKTWQATKPGQSLPEAPKAQQ